MMRGRISDRLESGREDVEGDLGCLGNARVLIGLVKQRVSMAANIGQESILMPAIEDLDKAGELISKAQSRIAARLDV